MLENAEQRGDEAARDRRFATMLARGFAALVAATLCLIVLGALVRAHEAGLACPDWPLCFGALVPEMNLRVAFEWSHRVLAGSVSLGFLALAAAALWRPATRRAAGTGLAVAAGLLAAQILLGALTVWKLLASWTVTSHLLTGNAFALTLLWIALSLRERGGAAPARPPISPAARGLVILSAGFLVVQVALGGLVSSRFAGLACPAWPTCNGGQWFPSWAGPVGLHLLHRTQGYTLLLALAAAAFAARRDPRLRGPMRIALAAALLQVAAGIANVLLGLPVEITALHSALAAALVLLLACGVREVWLARAPAAVRSEC